jgi:FtsP/CotA-like multicopper oxidase with cupredoxin domain
MISRRQLITSAALGAGASFLDVKAAQADGGIPKQPSTPHFDDPPNAGPFSYVPVETPNGVTMPWKMDGGVKVFHIVAEPVDREFAPGMIVKCWGYNGIAPGPTIECVEGDRVRLLVTNKLPEPTSIHWHGMRVPNGMDGVAGLVQPHIKPGETYVYEFTLREAGTFMYHPHSDEMVQMALGMMGFFIVHPRQRDGVDRDFAIMLHEWAIPPGTARPNPMVMTDFNTFTFNHRVWPGTAPLVVRTGQRVRVRLGNLSMDNHPIHLHGYHFTVTGTDAGRIPPSARWPENTVDVVVGSTRDIEWVADVPGDWVFHCHKSHHTMNAMSHDVPNMIGVRGTDERIKKVLPGAMEMGTTGMGAMMEMGVPKNTLPMMMGKGPYGPIQMGGMFTIVKVRDGISSYADPGFFQHPPGTVARKL